MICPSNEWASLVHGPCEKIRRATAGDVSGIVDIHREAFSHFFLTRLGGAFLRKYYGLVLDYQLGIILLAESDGELQGFACGFVAPSQFYRLMWRRSMRFVLPVLWALIRQPWLIPRVLFGVRRIQAPASEWPDASCELSSIAVAPRASGNGFGKSLIYAFLAEARSMEAQRVYLTTDAENNDAANGFYRDVGFRHTRRFLQQRGRWMNEYAIDGLEAGEPCEIPAEIDRESKG
jgi:ribosomal protein S18 acetylase RimI-like enzyme